MRAAVFDGSPTLHVMDVARPVAGPGELVVAVHACGLCGTDVRIAEGRKTKGVRRPSILGHELSGRIAEVGRGLERAWTVGDGVVVQPVVSCGECPPCRVGAENRCERRTAIGYEFDGGFAEGVLVPASAVDRGNVIPVPDSLDLAAAALAEPLAAVINGQEQVGLEAGDSVLVLGAGPIGLLHLQLALARGAKAVFVSEPGEARRAAAADMGATAVLDPSVSDVAAATREATGGLGVDVAIVAVGIPALVPLAVQAVRRGGGIDLFAGFDPGASSALDLNRVHYDELRIAGATASTRRQMGDAVGLLASGAIAWPRLISHSLPLDRIDEALDLVRTGQGRKVLIRP